MDMAISIFRNVAPTAMLLHVPASSFVLTDLLHPADAVPVVEATAAHHRRMWDNRNIPQQDNLSFCETPGDLASSWGQKSKIADPQLHAFHISWIAQRLPTLATEVEILRKKNEATVWQAK